MGQRCGCVGKECNCAIVPGRGVGFSGNGDQITPLEVTQSAPSYLRAASTNETAVTLNGTGVFTDPYLLSMDFVGTPDSRPLSVTNFSLGGTYQWVRPPGCEMIEVTCIGAGAGGGAGWNPAGGSAWGFGGLGGQGGGYTHKLILLPGYLTTLDCSVGYGGSPGTSPGEVGGIGFPSEVIDWDAAVPALAIAHGGGSGVTVHGEGHYRGVVGPTTTTDASLTVNVPAGAGGGKGANGNESETGAIFGGAHAAYDGTTATSARALASGGDGGRGGRAFQGTALVATGTGGDGIGPGGGGGGGRGGGAGLVLHGGTWTFAPSAGGGGAPGFIRIVAY